MEPPLAGSCQGAAGGSMSFLQLFVICQMNFCFYVLMYSELFYSVFDILQYSKVCTCLIKTDVHFIK